jgi:DUF2075 family protein
MGEDKLKKTLKSVVKEVEGKLANLLMTRDLSGFTIYNEFKKIYEKIDEAQLGE